MHIPYPPRIITELLPEPEREEALVLSDVLHRIRDYVTKFESAVSLFEFASMNARDNETIRQWGFIAARDGALMLFHFSKALQSLSGITRQIPSLPADNAILKTASKEFKEQFPGANAIRDYVAHAAEMSSSAKKVKRASVHGPGDIGAFDGMLTLVKAGSAAKVRLGDVLMGNNYVITNGGHEHSYEISRDSLMLLVGIQNTAYSAFTVTDTCGLKSVEAQ